MIRKYELPHVDQIHASDSSGPEYFGCDQNWYGTEWQRMSGCGPSTASTLLLYLQKTGRISLPIQINEQKDCRLLMDQVWEHVTPTSNGIYRAEQFCQGLRSFAGQHGFALHCQTLPISPTPSKRPTLATVTEFIINALEQDSPVAFLNLCNGEVSNLEEWHWLTLVALQTNDDFSDVTVTVFDGDKADTIDFASWLRTTTEGGALVYIR